MRLSTIWFCQVDALSCSENNALAGHDIGRDRPQPQRHIERIKAQRRPEGQLADPMLLSVTGGAQRDGVAITRFYADTAIGSGSHMRGLGGRGFAARDARQLPDKSEVLHPSTKVWLALAASHRERDARRGHRLEIAGGFRARHSMKRMGPSGNWSANHGVISRLARNAAFNANFPCGTGTSFVARIFSMTRSIKRLKLCNSRLRALKKVVSGSTRMTTLGSTSCQH